MRQFFITVAGVFAGLTLFVVVGVIFTWSAIIGAAQQSDASGGVVADVTVLDLDLRAPLLDQSQTNWLEIDEQPGVLDLVEALTRAESDDRVKGALIRASSYGLPLAQAEELDDAIASFRAAGKFVIAHAQGFESPSVTGYVAVASADEIWVSAASDFASTGLAIETPFFGGVFEKIDAEPQFEQFHEFKNAANTYTETDYTEPHREAMTALLGGLYDAALDAIAEGRGLDRATAKALIEGAPYSAERALELKLVDALGQPIEAEEAALAKAGEDAALTEPLDYLEAAGRPYRKGVRIALVAGQGAITTGEASDDPFASSDGIFSDSMSEAILDALDDEDVKAIILRVDSPGGSAIASDQIWHALSRAEAKGVPVVASFASVSASGGYYISAGADAIVALPSTITGSIGVLGGKIVLDGSYDLVGFNVGSLSVGGPFALAYSAAQPFTDDQRAAFRALMANVYEDFTGKVAEGRGLSIEQVRKIAKGRVWTGRQAQERQLVDHLGGYRTAIETARDLAGLDADADVEIKRFPAPKTWGEQFAELFGASAEGAQALSRIEALAATPEGRALFEAATLSQRSARGEITLLAPIAPVR